jgi:hypothetical protein
MYGIEQLLARRSWFVPEFTVWGLPGFGESDFLAVEQIGQTRSVLYGSTDLGGVEQAVTFDSLIDHRGNPLPATIESPLVIARPKGPAQPFVIGRESATGFRIARPSTSPLPIQIDLLVVELGD